MEVAKVMPKEVMRRNAKDNKYLHKDFHGALSVGLDYVKNNYGEEAVREYLRQFAEAFYSPLKEDLIRRGCSSGCHRRGGCGESPGSRSGSWRGRLWHRLE